MLPEVLKRSEHVSLEEVHGYQDTTVHNIQGQLTGAFAVLKRGEEGRTELADVVDQLIDELGLKVRIVLGEHGGNLAGKTIEIGSGLVEGVD